MHENKNIEYKRVYTADIKKEVMAFANSGGGVIYVGRDDDVIEWLQSAGRGYQTRMNAILREAMIRAEA